MHVRGVSLSAILLAQWAILLSVAALARWKGDVPIWRGAAWVVICALPVPFLQRIWGPDSLAFLILDGVYALGFLWLAIQFASIWLVVPLLCQALQFGAHAYYVIGEKPHDYNYWALNNGLTGLILTSLFVATLVTWLRPRRDRRRPLDTTGASSGGRTPN